MIVTRVAHAGESTSKKRRIAALSSRIRIGCMFG